MYAATIMDSLCISTKTLKDRYTIKTDQILACVYLVELEHIFDTYRLETVYSIINLVKDSTLLKGFLKELISMYSNALGIV